MNINLRKDIAAHAAKDYPREACGLIVMIGGTLRYIPCRNIAEGNELFILHPDDYADCDRLGIITAVVHSHPDHGPEPSQADLVACEATGLPWHIYSHPAGTWGYCEPCGYEAPILGRVFVHGVLDCYSLIRDWYKKEKRITLPDFERGVEWWRHGQNLYVENFEKAGFKRIIDEQPQHGDVLLMQILSNVPNHGAVYLEGDNIIHHLYNRLSSREVWGGYYRKHTTHILRHETADQTKNNPHR